MPRGERRPSTTRACAPPTPDEVAAWLDEIRPARAQLQVGELALAPGVAVLARCERLRPPHVPVRAVRLGQDLLARRSARAPARRDDASASWCSTRTRTTCGSATRVARATSATATPPPGRVRGGAPGPTDIKVRFRDLSPAHQAAAPAARPARRIATSTAEIARPDRGRVDPRHRRPAASDRASSLRLRMRNLGVGDFGIWPRSDLASPLPGRARRPEAAALPRWWTSARSPAREEQSLVGRRRCSSASGRDRARGEPVAIVIDEAHNVCPASPPTR